MGASLAVLRAAAVALVSSGRKVGRATLDLRAGRELAGRCYRKVLRRRPTGEVIAALVVLVDGLTDPREGDIELVEFVRAVRKLRAARGVAR